MYLNIFAKLVVLLALLMSAALADCYTSGNTWSDIGDDDTIVKVFKIICLDIAGDYHVGDTIAGCVNVHNHRVDTSITISQTENSSFSTEAHLYQEVCEMLLSKVKSDCNDKGGVKNEFANIGPEFHKYGFIIGDVTADPNEGNC